MDEEYDVDSPHHHCHHLDYLGPVPNCDTGILSKYLIWGNCRNTEVKVKTYTRRTSNSEAAAADTYMKI